VNISGKNISDLSPVQKLPKLKMLIASKTQVTDLFPLSELKEMNWIDISETSVKSLSPLERLPKLKLIIANKTKVENIEFQAFASLQKLFVDGTSVNDITAIRFLEKNPKCLLVYKTVLLKEWWITLPGTWREIFAGQEGMSSSPSTEQLHHLIEQQKLTGKDVPVSSLSMLSEFIQLKELSLSGTALTTIAPIESIRLLKSLHITSSPLTTIEGINFFIDLEELDISNTPIADIYPVWQLSDLKKLNCAGTQIKRIDALEKLENLEYFDCSNTNVNKLDALSYLKLKTLKCFNTRVSNKAIENFKAAHPGCSVMYYR
jgi:Leucine-rich repeat (LRR) protein